ncbi:MAG: amidohydrolase [Clostridia bacterium]|nr:amidohydrolase [Clostridia bacterium]
MNQDGLIAELFQKLHESPELSMQETRTRAIIVDFLRSHTDFSVYDCGNFLYACHLEGESLENIAFRADMDAIRDSHGKPFHGCGHDGHVCTLCRLALEISNKKAGKNIYLFFQPAEETGQGALLMLPLLREKNITRIYGFHNIPGKTAGKVLLKSRTFACASRGLKLIFKGRQCHAAYPETGVNPALAIAKVIMRINDVQHNDYGAPVLATIVNVQLGEPNAFGVSAGYGELSCTVRSETDAAMERLQEYITGFAEKICEESGISLEIQTFDEFPSTVNSETETERAEHIFRACGVDFEVLKTPMRWSEDFGYYLKNTSGLFMGIGAGEDVPPLHTDGYGYNTEIIEQSAKMLMLLI